MSKVNHYLDSKRKALHRQRRYETAHKKFSRAGRTDRGEYYYWGYHVEREKYRVHHTWVKTPRGTSICIPQFEKIGGDVFIVGRISKDAFVGKGSTCKKDCDIPRSLL